MGFAFLCKNYCNAVTGYIVLKKGYYMKKKQKTEVENERELSHQKTKEMKEGRE